MKIIKLIIAILLSSILLYFGNHSLKFGNTSLPPLLKFLDPFGGFWQNAENVKAYPDFSLQIEGLKEEVQIVYDSRKVAHIFANNIEDALFAQGYVEAQERLWQMDFSSRSGAGRLAEVVGERLVEYDKNRRRLGLSLAAENAVEGWKQFPEEYARLGNYVKGVNAYMQSLNSSQLPIEFKLLNYKPELWTPYHSALIAKSMAYILCSRENDMESSNMLNYLGRVHFDLLYPEINPKQAPIIPAEKEWTFDHDLSDPDSLATSIEEIIFHRHLEKPSPGIGSNNWAVSGQKTKSGTPILCNDPHLGLSLPSVWMEIHIHTPDFSAYGVSIPGIPGIMSGFNEDIAWGVTNVGQDILDWYKIEWTDNSKTKYNLDGEIKEVSYQIEEIKVNSSPSVFDTIKHTYWGPVVYENHQRISEDLSMRWLAHDIPDRAELSTFVNLMSAENYTDYDQALAPYISPAQNFAFAAKDGDIGLIVNGKFPKKIKEEGRFVRMGNDSKYNWKEFIPRDELAQIKNPKREFIASANQHSTAPDYPHYYIGGFEDYRSRSIRDILLNEENIDAEFMKKMQFNSFSVKASDALPIMLSTIQQHASYSDLEESAIEILNTWDYRYQANEKGPTLFELWFNSFYSNTWDEIYSLRDSFDVLYPESWVMTDLLKDDPVNEYFDRRDTKDKIETAADILIESIKEAIEEFKSLDKENKASWADYRPVDIYHLFRIPEFSSLDLKTDGHQNTINANKGSFGPSWRMIVELGDKVNAYGVYPGGQSGNPGSQFYDNMVEDWTLGNYYKINFIQSPDELGAEKLYNQKLQPK